MNPRRLASAASAAVLALLLAACAVPGQGTPGVAATDGDRVITVADTVVVEHALIELYAPAHPGEALTLLLLAPEIDAAARATGATFSERDLRVSAQLWVSNRTEGQLNPVDFSPEALDVVLMVRQVNHLVNTEGGFQTLVEIVERLEAEVEASPRYGDFTLDNFAQSFDLILSDFINRQAEMGPAIFLLFKDVNGFDAMGNPDWVRDV